MSARDEIAEVLSWTSGEMTRYADDAHLDHNRWSWRGDGHGEALREEFRRQADALLAAGIGVVAEAWDEAIATVERQTNLADLMHFDRPSDFRKGVLTSLMALKAGRP